uniref:26S proteasome non-ATPase regulatory subunit 8 n=1 Tax=Syphacia muris TaxID=451379 RepID=A0A0N5AW61_9BILA
MARLELVHKKLLDEWKKDERRNIQLIGEILKEAKLFSLTFDDIFLKHYSIFILGDVFEIDAMYALLCEDFERFNEAITVVLNFYNSYSSASQSSNKYLMVGLDLMYLLATNRLAEFHMLLEQIEQSVQETNPYITTPVYLEQSLMEGVYNKVVLTEGNIPSPFYSIFIRILMDTVRGEIASCIESAFKRLSVRDAAQMLFFSNTDDVIPFTKQRGWQVTNGVYFFNDEKPSEVCLKVFSNSMKLSFNRVFRKNQEYIWTPNELLSKIYFMQSSLK